MVVLLVQYMFVGLDILQVVDDCIYDVYRKQGSWETQLRPLHRPTKILIRWSWLRSS